MKKYSLTLSILLLVAATNVYSMLRHPRYYQSNEQANETWATKKEIKDAVMAVNFQSVKTLIDNSDDRAIQINNAMYYAGKCGQLPIAENVITTYPYALTLEPLRLFLHAAISGGYLELVKFGFSQSKKIKDGPSIENTNYFFSPLYFAVEKFKPRIVQYLIESGADRKFECAARFPTPLLNALSYSGEASDKTAKAILTTITLSERKRIITAICSLKKGNLTDCTLFPKDIYQHITLMLIDQFTDEHMIEAKELCYPKIKIFDEKTIKQKLDNIVDPKSWNELTKTVNTNFRRIVRPPKEEVDLDPPPKKKEFGALRKVESGY